jgi:hypothetical protein
MVADAMDEDLVPPERFRGFDSDEESNEEGADEGDAFGAFPYTPGS